MQTALSFLIDHGYLVVFVWVLLGQAGLPVPAVPVLFAAGALAGAGRLDVATVVALSCVASLVSDSAWFAIGRRLGTRVLALLCKVALEPESCVRGAEARLVRHGALTLAFAKFVPGVSTVAPPLAGMAGMGLLRFLVSDGLGALVWTLAFVVPGYLFADRFEQFAAQVAAAGTWLAGLFGAALAAIVLVKVWRRQAFLRLLRIARITPAELRDLLAGSAPPFVVDLRHAFDYEADPFVVPGALHVLAERIEDHLAAVPRDRDVVLYCT